MNNNEPANPSAFPQTTLEECRDGVTNVTDPKQPGMSLRDYFAAKALPSVYSAHIKAMEDGELHGNEFAKVTAQSAYELADAMLKARTA